MAAKGSMPIRPGPAIWRTKEYDFDVIVEEYLGELDGVKYWRITRDGGSTGVPESELYIAPPRDPLEMFRKRFRRWR